MNVDCERLALNLGYGFKDPNLLLAALTHRSASSRHNERLEFLGDAILGLVVARELFNRRPDAAEGDLSRWRASLVKKAALGDLARDLDLGQFIVLGSGELKSGGRRRESILADALEAIFGAIYLDSDYETCYTVITKLYAEKFAQLPAAIELKDPKTRLQEWLQARKHPLPEYDVVHVVGKSHEQQFTVKCKLLDLQLSAEAQDSSRRSAEQAAAERVLAQLDDSHG